MIFKQFLSIFLSVLLAAPTFAQNANVNETVIKDGNLIGVRRVETVEIPIRAGVTEIRHTYSTEIVNTKTGERLSYVREDGYIQDLRLNQPSKTPVQANGYICDGLCHQIDPNDISRVSQSLAQLPPSIPVESSSVANKVKEDLEEAYPDYHVPSDGIASLQYEFGSNISPQQVQDTVQKMARSQEQSLRQVSTEYQQKWAQRDAIVSQNTSAVKSLENYHSALVDRKNISASKLSYQLGKIYSEIPKDLSSVIVDPTKARVTYRYVSDGAGQAIAVVLPKLIKEDPVAAALKVSESITPNQPIPQELKPYVDSSGILKGTVLKPNSIRPAGSIANQIRTVRAANLLQASEMRSVKPSATVYGSNLLTVASLSLQAAQGEYARGASEVAESFMLTAEFAVQFLTGVALGVKDGLVGDVTGFAELGIGSAKLLSAYFKDPEKTHELALGALKVFCNNIDKIAVDHWNKTKDTILHGEVKDAAKIAGNLSYQVASLVFSPLAILGKAGITTKVITETAEASAKAATRVGELMEEAQRVTKMAGREIDFLSHPNGIIPNQGYRYFSEGSPDLAKVLKNGVIEGIDHDGATYGTFEKFSDAVKAESGLQLPYTPKYRAEFKLQELVDDIEIPKSNWNTGPDLEPIVKSLPGLGSGGYPQFILKKDFKVDKLFDINTGKLIWQSVPK